MFESAAVIAARCAPAKSRRAFSFIAHRHASALVMSEVDVQCFDRAQASSSAVSYMTRFALTL
jgi:hypothetical protein